MGRSKVLNVCRKVKGGGRLVAGYQNNQGERVNSNPGHFCDNVISEHRGPVASLK